MRSCSVTIVYVFQEANKPNWVSVSYVIVCMIFILLQYKSLTLTLTLTLTSSLSILYHAIYGAVCFQLIHCSLTCEKMLFHLNIITKSEVWTIIHCFGLGHETIVYAVNLLMFWSTDDHAWCDVNSFHNYWFPKYHLICCCQVTRVGIEEFATELYRWSLLLTYHHGVRKQVMGICWYQLRYYSLTETKWRICALINYAIISSDNGFAPKVVLLLIGPMGTNCSITRFKIQKSLSLPQL